MRKILFTLFCVCVALLVYELLFYKEAVYIPEQELVIIDPYATVEPETLRIDNPTFVFPAIIEHSVTVTVYHAVEGQTDSTPDILADGTVIDLAKAGSYRFCALSRDLLERWEGPYAYGSSIFIDGIGEFTGVWIVRDTMHKRWKNHVDLLVDIDIPPYKFSNVTMRMVHGDNL